MRKNRKISKRRSVVGMHTMHIGAMMLMGAVVAIFNLLASSSCNQLMKSIGEKEAKLQVKKAELDRARARWEATTSSDSIDRLLARHGIEVSHPKIHRTVRMDAAGRPAPGQRSVASARARARNLSVAQLGSPRR